MDKIQTNSVSFMKCLIFSTAFIIFSFTSTGQIKKKPLIKKNKCTTFVYNLTNGNMHMKDICFSILITDHIDMNQYNPGRERDKTKDFWKFSISINDNDNKAQQNFNASFYLYVETDEIKQYHCNVEDVDFKAIIFDKVHNSWQILMLQNDEYKILSSYTGYHYTNAFGIKEKKGNDKGY